MPTDPDLTDGEINRICAGLKQGFAQVRFLTSMGLTVRRKPNGRPLVNRKHYDAVHGAGNSGELELAGAEPNWST